MKTLLNCDTTSQIGIYYAVRDKRDGHYVTAGLIDGKVPLLLHESHLENIKSIFDVRGLKRKNYEIVKVKIEEMMEV